MPAIADGGDGDEDDDFARERDVRLDKGGGGGAGKGPDLRGGRGKCCSKFIHIHYVVCRVQNLKSTVIGWSSVWGLRHWAVQCGGWGVDL